MIYKNRLKQKFTCNCGPKGATKISECVRKYVDRISQNLQSLNPYSLAPLTVFLFLQIMVNQSNHQVSRYQRVNWYPPVCINQSVLSNRRVELHQRIFCFPIISHNSIFSTHMKRVCHSNKWKSWHLHCSILKLLIVIE